MLVLGNDYQIEYEKSLVLKNIIKQLTSRCSKIKKERKINKKLTVDTGQVMVSGKV